MTKILHFLKVSFILLSEQILLLLILIIGSLLLWLISVLSNYSFHLFILIFMWFNEAWIHCELTIVDAIQPQHMSNSTTDESENRASQGISLKAPRSLSQQCVCQNCGFCMFYRVYLAQPSHSASPYQHSDRHYQRSVGYTQGSHLSFSFFCFEKPKPDTGWQPLLFTQLEGHGRLFREHDTAYWAAIWRTAGPPHQPALSTSVKTQNPTEYQIHRPIFKQSEVHMMIWVRDWGIEPGNWNWHSAGGETEELRKDHLGNLS